jgi:hypothetical protein
MLNHLGLDCHACCLTMITLLQSRSESHHIRFLTSWVSLETSFNSKQPKLQPKLSETKRLFWLFRFYTKAESFDVSIGPKQTEDQPKQLDRGHILVFL